MKTSLTISKKDAPSNLKNLNPHHNALLYHIVNKLYNTNHNIPNWAIQRGKRLFDNHGLLSLIEERAEKIDMPLPNNWENQLDALKSSLNTQANNSLPLLHYYLLYHIVNKLCNTDHNIPDWAIRNGRRLLDNPELPSLIKKRAEKMGKALSDNWEILLMSKEFIPGQTISINISHQSPTPHHSQDGFNSFIQELLNEPSLQLDNLFIENGTEPLNKANNKNSENQPFDIQNSKRSRDDNTCDNAPLQKKHKPSQEPQIWTNKVSSKVSLDGTESTLFKSRHSTFDDTKFCGISSSNTTSYAERVRSHPVNLNDRSL